MPDLVAVVASKFSPTVLESLPVIHERKLIVLDAWAAADGIVDNGYKPNYVFRLSLRDSWAMPAMLAYAKRRGWQQLGVMLPHTGWGVSNDRALSRHAAKQPGVRIIDRRWYDPNAHTIASKYNTLFAQGAQAILFVGNEPEGAHLVRTIAQLPAQQRLPVISHWGITGGNLPEMTGEQLRKINLAVVQTYSFIDAKRPKTAHVISEAKRLLGVSDARAIPSPVGVAHAYDLVHILALAIERAGTTDRAAIRDALEHVENYDGLIKFYRRPFTPDRHEALAEKDVFLARYAVDGALERDTRR